MLSIRRNISLVLVTVALMMFAAVPLRADVTSVTFHDTGETVTADVSGRASITQLGGVNLCGLIDRSTLGRGQGVVEGCLVTVLPPTGFGNDLEGGEGTVLIGDSKHGNVSDIIVVFSSSLLPSAFGTIDGVQVLFLSDTQEVPFGPCPSTTSGCSKVETGGVQEGRDLFWLHGNDSIHDKVFFQSDLTEVPEPSSLVLLGSGLLAVASYLKRRLA